ncbi:hypothetical protein [Photobacterium kagoshimensis]|uniref:hypothetical protein n=1 Tax=Photobacterium kagoshimensis TaxID=2910242 RepID=UPI003D101594
MKKLLCLLLLTVLWGCGGSNSDGSSVLTYSSCKIVNSQALFQVDRDKDLTQCWNAAGDGYESKGDAQQWCAREVNAYISDTYLLGHTVTYAVESTYCP